MPGARPPIDPDNPGDYATLNFHQPRDGTARIVRHMTDSSTAWLELPAEVAGDPNEPYEPYEAVDPRSCCDDSGATREGGQSRPLTRSGLIT